MSEAEQTQAPEPVLVKQIIVMRRDLGMRRGKEIAQGSHASMMFLLEHIRTGNPFSPAERHWVEKLMAKICVKVNSEEELVEVALKASRAGLRVHMVTDAGRTEFKGVPTKTCCAIGPDYAEKIDPITRSLTLL